MQKETPNALRKHDNFEIIFFELDNDSCPVQDFLDSLNDKMAAKVYGMMDVLAEFGNELREPYTKELEDEIYELRAKTGTDICRVLFFFRSEKKNIITNGFIKKATKDTALRNQFGKEISKGLSCQKKGCRKMKTYRSSLDDRLKDQNFRSEYENIQPEIEIIRTLVRARKEQNLTQKELSEISGINQADISKLENGNRNPSLGMLKRLACALGMTLKIEFVSEKKPQYH